MEVYTGDQAPPEYAATTAPACFDEPGSNGAVVVAERRGWRVMHVHDATVFGSRQVPVYHDGLFPVLAGNSLESIADLVAQRELGDDADDAIDGACHCGYAIVGADAAFLATRRYCPACGCRFGQTISGCPTPE